MPINSIEKSYWDLLLLRVGGYLLSSMLFSLDKGGRWEKLYIWGSGEFDQGPGSSRSYPWWKRKIHHVWWGLATLDPFAMHSACFRGHAPGPQHCLHLGVERQPSALFCVQEWGTLLTLNQEPQHYNSSSWVLESPMGREDIPGFHPLPWLGRASYMGTRVLNLFYPVYFNELKWT